MLPTVLLPRMKHLSYEDRLIKLNLTTLEQRRERGDIIQTYKIMHGLSDVNINELFTMVEDDSITRRQCVVVDGISSSPVDVDSGVPQGTVLVPILFLLHINDLPSIVSTKVRLFADDCLIYKQIKNNNDQIELQRDLNLLESWGAK